MKSLSRLLLLALLSVVVLAATVSGLLAYRAGIIEAGELFDAKLAHSARVLLGLVDPSLKGDLRVGLPPIVIAVWPGVADGGGADLATPGGHAYETKLAFQVWSADGSLLMTSDSAPAQALAPLAAGFHEVVLDGQRWRSFALLSESGRWFLAGEREDVRADIAGDIAIGILSPLLVELPVLALLIWIVIRLGERALRRVVGEVEQRAVGHLQPISSERTPVEIRGLVEAINRLLETLDAALQRERRFTADAAHELRTPLAALRMQLSNLREAGSADARRLAEDQLERGLLRLDRLVDQLLTLSRLEPGVPLASTNRFDLLALAREVIAEQVNVGRGRDVEIELCAEDAEVPLQGDPIGIGILLRNLVDNALRYTPAGGSARVSLAAGPDGIDVVVEDSGPGIPVEARERVLERFHRELGSGVEGSGLGLSIVERVARIHGASLMLGVSPTLAGLRVALRFPHRP